MNQIQVRIVTMRQTISTHPPYLAGASQAFASMLPEDLADDAEFYVFDGRESLGHFHTAKEADDAANEHARQLGAVATGTEHVGHSDVRLNADLMIGTAAPTCNGCKADVVSVTGERPFVVTVESPDGDVVRNYFCGSCISNIALAGAQILSVPFAPPGEQHGG